MGKSNDQQNDKKNWIIITEIIGFCSIIILLWTNKIFDFPHRIFGAQSTPINWIEETIGVPILGVLIITISLYILMKIRYLDRFLPVCSFL